MTVYVGVDIAKSTHYAAMTNQHGEVLVEPFSFNNDKPGFDLFLKTLQPYLSKNEKVIVGFESTAHYTSNFSHFLDQNSISYKVINPLVTSNFRRTKIRKTKTDSIDSLLICNILSLNIDNDKESMIRDKFFLELYSLCSCRFNLVTMRTKAKIQLVTYIDRIFPELATFFNGNLHLNTVYQLIKSYPTPDEIKKVRIDRLTNFLDNTSNGRFKKDKAVALKELAKRSVGLPGGSYVLQAQLAVNQIELFTSQIKSLDKQIDEAVKELKTPTSTVPGLSSFEIAVILSATNNFTNFDSPRKVLAFAGLDPVVCQSGQWKAASTRMSKRGNSLLRYVLIWSANNVCRHNKTFGDYYKKKRDEGKSHYCALGHCTNKLIRVLFKLVKEGKDFDLE